MTRCPVSNEPLGSDQAKAFGSWRNRWRHFLKDGRRLGKVRVSVIDTAVVDTLYKKLLVVRETHADGTDRARATHHRQSRDGILPSGLERRRAAATPASFPSRIPLPQWGSSHRAGKRRRRPSPSCGHSAPRRSKLGFSSLATAALIGWEWLQCEIDILDPFEVTHYRPKERPNSVGVVHETVGCLVMLRDAAG
jgi:hypothetical protein